MACYPPCPEGCDLTCETTVTWTPDPERVYVWPSGRRTGTGVKFFPDETGGGRIEARSKTTKRWVVLGIKKPHVA